MLLSVGPIGYFELKVLKKVQIQEGPFVVFNWGFRARIQMVLGLGQGKISICISLISV